MGTLSLLMQLLIVFSTSYTTFAKNSMPAHAG
nr:MAG TPA: hypothetical protein [Caudoviricetes sp.]